LAWISEFLGGLDRGLKGRIICCETGRTTISTTLEGAAIAYRCLARLARAVATRRRKKMLAS
jgi:hypothetical protein